MKKLLFLLLVSFLVSAACGQDESKTEDKKESKSSLNDDKKKDKNKKSNDETKDTSNATNTQQNNTQQANTEQQTQNFEQRQSTQEPIQSQEQMNNQEQQTTQTPLESQEQQTTELETQNQKIDLNQFPGGDFSTEGMSEDAQKQIEELSRQKDYEGLPQKEYNDQVSEIMNNEMN